MSHAHALSSRQGRLVLDVSSIVRWTGPPVGITRVEAALAAEAWRRPGTLLACWDPGRKMFRGLRDPWAPLLTGWSAALQPRAEPRSRGWRTLVPSRLPVVTSLERTRLTALAPLAALAGLAQAALLAPRRHGYPWRDAAGKRFANVPEDLALGGDVELGPADVVLSAGSPWFYLAAMDLAAFKRRAGFRYASLCYDLIPITHPHFFPPDDRERFERHWRGVFGFADLLIVNAACIAADVRRYGATLGVQPRTAVASLGHDQPRSPGRLPTGLQPHRFAVFVSTIEPRKGHAMLLRVWEKLLARKIPQSCGFDLVFVGREGWMVDEVMRVLERRPARLHHLARVDDDVLSALYRACAFSLYPSLYEGYGLPLIEAFAYGKTAIVSTGGALPETAAGRALCLPAEDEAAWEATLADWIQDPRARAPYEARIAQAGPGEDWPTAASRILELAAGTGETRSLGADPQSKPG